MSDELTALLCDYDKPQKASLLELLQQNMEYDLARGTYVKGSPRHRRLLSAQMEAKAMLAAMEFAYKTIRKFGDMQDNAFYYNGHAAPELIQVVVNLEQFVRENQR